MARVFPVFRIVAELKQIGFIFLDADLVNTRHLAPESTELFHFMAIPFHAHHLHHQLQFGTGFVLYARKAHKVITHLLKTRPFAVKLVAFLGGSVKAQRKVLQRRRQQLSGHGFIQKCAIGGKQRGNVVPLTILNAIKDLAIHEWLAQADQHHVFGRRTGLLHQTLKNIVLHIRLGLLMRFPGAHGAIQIALRRGLHNVFHGKGVDSLLSGKVTVQELPPVECSHTVGRYTNCNWWCLLRHDGDRGGFLLRMKCIISGGRGFIGRRLVDALLADHHYVAIWSRTPGQEKRMAVGAFYWDPLSGEPAEESLHDFDAVVHLAGEPVAARWTPEVKQRIRDSRVLGTRRLVDAIAKVQRKPKVLVCASAIGYYGSRGNEILTEDSGPGTDFLAVLCQEWEREADRAATLGLRVVKIRVGVVLGQDGGAFAAMLPAFRAFLGGKLGSGTQWMPWIHVDDVAAMFRYAIEHDVHGVWNGTAPNPVTNAEFTRQLQATLKRPSPMRVPAFALKLMLGELADRVLGSARVLPKAAQEAGFVWQYPELTEALKQLVG